MSHQVIQICDDLVKFRTNGRNVSFDSPEVGAGYAWVALQSLQCMDGYLQAKFRCHQGINLTKAIIGSKKFTIFPRGP